MQPGENIALPMTTSKAQRSKVRPATIRKLASFYEGRPDSRLKCVVTENPAGCSLHHLNEDPSQSNVEFNLLPLSIGLNHQIDRRDIHQLDLTLQPPALRARAGYYFSHGKYAYGYGCSVLGASLYYYKPWKARRPRRYSLDANSVALFCADALINLRPLNRLDYAVSLLTTILAPVFKRFGEQVDRVTSARVAMEIGSYFRDAGDYGTARHFIALARHTLRLERKSAWIRTLLARLWHHEGIAAIGEAIREGANPKAAEEHFKRARDEMTAGYSVGDANAALYEAHMLLRSTRPNLERVTQLAGRYPDGSDPLVLTRWTSIELRIAKAQAEYQKGGAVPKQRAFEQIREVLQVIENERIVPTRAIFAPSLLAFADEYSGHQRDVLGLLRELSPRFVRIAKAIEKELRRLAEL